MVFVRITLHRHRTRYLGVSSLGSWRNSDWGRGPLGMGGRCEINDGWCQARVCLGTRPSPHPPSFKPLFKFFFLQVPCGLECCGKNHLQHVRPPGARGRTLFVVVKSLRCQDFSAVEAIVKCAFMKSPIFPSHNEFYAVFFRYFAFITLRNAKLEVEICGHEKLKK